MFGPRVLLNMLQFLREMGVYAVISPLLFQSFRGNLKREIIRSSGTNHSKSQNWNQNLGFPGQTATLCLRPHGTLELELFLNWMAVTDTHECHQLFSCVPAVELSRYTQVAILWRITGILYHSIEFTGILMDIVSKQQQREIAVRSFCKGITYFWLALLNENRCPLFLNDNLSERGCLAVHRLCVIHINSKYDCFFMRLRWGRTS